MRDRFARSPRSYRRAFAHGAVFVGCLTCLLHADELVSPRKPSRSQFDPKELSDLVNDVLLIPPPSNDLPKGGRPVRTLHGEVVDAEGKPIPGAQVALAYSSDGRYGYSYFDNYDKTDEVGRFVVADFDFRTTIIVNRAPGLSWRGQIEPNQTTLHVAWPANGRVRVTIPAEVEGAEHGVYLQLARRTAGVSAKRLGPAVRDAQGTATFDEVPPAEFRIFAPIAMKWEGGKTVYAEREFGRFTLASGEMKDVLLDTTTRVAVRGEAGPVAGCVTIEHDLTRKSTTYGSVDGVKVGADGRFAAHIPGPGVYCLTVLAKPLPIVNGQPQGRVYLNGVVARRRFVVDEATREIHIAIEDDRSPTAAFVQNSLDEQIFQGGDHFVSYSMTDVKVANIVRHEDHAGVAEELLRIINDPNSPQSWEYVTLEALGKMVEIPGVVEGLLAVLRRDDLQFKRSGVIDALNGASAELPRIVKEVAPLIEDEDRIVRWEVCYCLGRLTLKHPELREQVAPTLIAALTDPFDRTRQTAAATLDSHKCAAAIPALRTLLSDRNIHVRLSAAYAIWEISDDAEPLITLAGGILQHDDEDYELKKDAAYALRGVPNLPTRTIGALMGYARNAPRQRDMRDRSKSAHHLLGSACQQVLDDYVAAADAAE